MIKNFDAENFDDTLFYQVLEEFFDIKILTEEEKKLLSIIMQLHIARIIKMN